MSTGPPNDQPPEPSGGGGRDAETMIFVSGVLEVIALWAEARQHEGPAIVAGLLAAYVRIVAEQLRGGRH